MAAMAQQAMAAMRKNRSSLPTNKPGKPSGSPKASQQEESVGGAKLGGPGGPGTPLPGMVTAKGPKTWGKLPPKLAEDLSRGAAESVPEEYRQAVETYYRVIAEKAKKR